MDDLPSVQLLRGEQPEPLLLHAVHRESGEEQWSLLKATAVRDSTGAIEAAVTIIEDVTQRRRATLRMEFLARVGDVLASSMDQMQELYDAGMARLEDIMVYVDARFPLKGMPDDAKALVHLGQSIVMVSFPVEVWKQPRVLDSGAAYIQLVKEPVV